VTDLSDFDDNFHNNNNPEMDEKPVDDTDLSGMELEDAKEYILAFIQTLKETQAKINKLGEETVVWNERIKLAVERNKTDLKLAAEEKAAEIYREIDMLSREESELKSKISVMKENLKKLKHKFNFTVDTEQMLADIEMLVGKKDELSDKFKQEEAEKRLEELKKRMGKEES
jgi:phage shock protein A